MWSIGRSYFTGVDPLLLKSLPAIPLEHDHSSDLDYNAVYDNRQEQAQSVSASLPSNVTLAPLPTAREAEVFPIAKNS